MGDIQSGTDAVIIAAVISGVIVIAIAVIFIVVAYFVLKNRSKEFKPSPREDR